MNNEITKIIIDSTKLGRQTIKDEVNIFLLSYSASLENRNVASYISKQYKGKINETVVVIKSIVPYCEVVR